MSAEPTLIMSAGRSRVGVCAAPWVGVKQGMHNGKQQTERELLHPAINWTTGQQTFMPSLGAEYTSGPTNSGPGYVAYFVTEMW